MDEVEYLRAQVKRLRAEIAKSPPPIRTIKSELKGEVKQRRAWQNELELALHRLTEVQETKRVEEVKRQAVESGFVVTPSYGHANGMGECPLCENEFLDYIEMETGDCHYIFPCCGTRICYPCLHTTEQLCEQAAKALKEGKLKGVDLTSAQVADFKAMMWECPCCHEDRSLTKRLSREDRILSEANAGHAWAQYEVGRTFFPGEDGRATQRKKSIPWYKRAADQGHVMALSMMLQLDPKHEDEYTLTAARHGDRMAQFMIARSQGTPDDQAVIWCALAAAQTFAPAELLMARFCFHGPLDHVERKDDPFTSFKSAYWLRRAALQGDAEAQLELSEHLLRAKAEIFDEVPDIEGYSGVPEAVFWFELSRQSAAFSNSKRPPYFDFSRCGNCGRFDVDIKRCVSCKAVGYCGKECQTLHWKIGHKVDCKSANKWKEAVKAKAPKVKTFPQTDHGKIVKRLAQLHEVKDTFPNYSCKDFNDALQPDEFVPKDGKRPGSIHIKKDGSMVVNVI